MDSRGIHLRKPLRQNNLVIRTASRHKGPQQNTLNCTGYFGAPPNRSVLALSALAERPAEPCAFLECRSREARERA